MSTPSQSSWPERIDPLETDPGVVAYHLKKYEFASARLEGVVVDVACGVGYGTFYLGAAATMVIGIEIASAAITVAKDRYRRDNVYFVQGNAERLSIAGGRVDAVTCFEGIEHFHDPSQHLDEVVRVLKTDGTYFVSTPHPDMHPHGQDNPYHLHEFEPGQFEAMLRRRFESVEMLSQRRIQSDVHVAAQRLDFIGLRRLRILRPATKAFSRRFLKTTPTEDATLADFVIEPFGNRATEYVAVCTGPRQ